MTREVVKMLRNGVRPVVVVGCEAERDELLARIAVLEDELRIANRALARLLEPKIGMWADDGLYGMGFIPWVEEEEVEGEAQEAGGGVASGDGDADRAGDVGDALAGRGGGARVATAAAGAVPDGV